MDGNKTGLKINQAYNSQSSISEESDGLTASEAFKRRERRKDFNKRHTLVGIENAEDIENLHLRPQRQGPHKVKETPLIMDYLKRKYPEHSDRLDGKTLAAESPAVSNGFYETDLDNLDTMSEIDTEATGFRRGGRLRSSLPVVRPIVNKTKERPLGLIYLRYKNETKRALMPNEVTGIDTVRALYVRAFPKQLNMRMLEQPERKIYIKDTTTDIFYELENVNDIHDRTVLKIYEPGFVEDPNLQGPSSPRSTASTPVELDYYSEPEVDHMKRDTRPIRYQAMTLPRNLQYTQEGGGVQRPPNLTSSPDKGGGRQPPPPDNFRRGAPERASATIPRPAAHNQAFQRLTPERASVSGPVNRGPNSAPPQVRRGPPPPRREGSATMPRRLPQDGSWNGGQRPQNSATMPRPKGGVTAVDDGGFSALRPPGDNRGFAESTRLSKSQPLADPVNYSMQAQTSAMPEQNGRPQPRGQHPHQQTPPGRPVNQGTLPRNGAPGPRHPMPNGTGPPPQRGPGPLRRHGSHEGPLQGRPHSAPSIEGAVPPRQGVHPGAQRPYSQPATRTTPGRPPSVEEDTNERIMAMEQQIANLAGMVRSVIGPRNGTPRQPPMTQRDGQRPPGDPRQPPPRREPPMVRADSAPQHPRPQGPGPQQIRSPAPQQIRAPAPQQSRPPGPQQPGRPHPHQPGGVNVQRSAMVLKHRTTDLRMQLKQLRKMHLNMVQQMNNNFRSTSHKIRVAMESAPGSDKHPIRNQRGRVHQEYIRYMQAQEKIERELRELDQNVEKLRDQTISHRGSVDMDRIDHLAQALGNSSRRIAEQKVTFPVLAEKLKAVQEGEMEIVVREENWMKHEPQRLDDYLKRSKKITSTLYTLKRMATTHNEPYATLPTTPTAATVTISNVEPPKHVERVESVPLPENMAVRQENADTKEVSEVHHKLPRRFKSPHEQEAFERKLEEKRDELKKTSNVNALATRHRRNLREMYDQENHDAMTPIITPEKAAKKEAQKEATAAQKKGPPPPPPPRRHFPVSPPPEQSEKKITWSTTETTSKKPKVPNDVETVAESVVESVPESETNECDGVTGANGEGNARGLSNASSSSADCLVHAVAVDPPQSLSTVKSQETSKSSPSLGVSDDAPKDLNGSFQSETLGQVGNGGVAHSNGLAGSDSSNSSKAQGKKSSLFNNKGGTSPSKPGQQGSSGGKSKSKKMGGALARLLRRDSGKSDHAHKSGSTSSNTGPPPKPPRGCLDSPTQQTKKLFVGPDGKPIEKGGNSNNNAKPITVPQKEEKQGTDQSRRTKSAENISLSSSPEQDVPTSQGIYNVQQRQIIQDTHAAGSTVLRNTMSVTLSSPKRTVSESANVPNHSSKIAPSSVETKQRETDPAVRPKRQSSFGASDPKTIQLKAQYAKLRQMQIENNSNMGAAPNSGGNNTATKETRTPASPQASSASAAVRKSAVDQVPNHHEVGCMQNGVSPQLNEKNVKIKSPPPPVAAKPQPITKTTSQTVTKTTPQGVSKTTTTTTTTKRSYQIEDVNQALDELESLAFKATETTDLATEDSNIIKDSSPSSPNGTIQKPVHAQIRFQQSPPRSFATKPKPLSPKGFASISKVGGKSSAFTPVKVTSTAVNKGGATSPLSTTSSSPPSSSASSPTEKVKKEITEKEAADGQTEILTDTVTENKQEALHSDNDRFPGGVDKTPEGGHKDSGDTATITVTETVVHTTRNPVTHTKKSPVMITDLDEHIANNNGNSETTRDGEVNSNGVKSETQPDRKSITNDNGNVGPEGGDQAGGTNGNTPVNGNVQEMPQGGVDESKDVVVNKEEVQDLKPTEMNETEKHLAIPKGAHIAEVKTIIVNGIIEETFIN